MSGDPFDLFRHAWLFRLLARRPWHRLVSDNAFYWLADRIGGNDGWRPLHMRQRYITGPKRP